MGVGETPPGPLSREIDLSTRLTQDARPLFGSSLPFVLEQLSIKITVHLVRCFQFSVCNFVNTHRTHTNRPTLFGGVSNIKYLTLHRKVLDESSWINVGTSIFNDSRQLSRYTRFYFFLIRTSKFWPSLVVLKFLHNSVEPQLLLSCSRLHHVNYTLWHCHKSFSLVFKNTCDIVLIFFSAHSLDVQSNCRKTCKETLHVMT